MKKILQTIQELSLLPGISGQEDAVRTYLLNRLEGHGELTVDPLGNILVFKKGKNAPKNTLYFSAHMDEVGFMITGITKEGFLQFATVGGIDPRVIFGKAVQVGSQLLPGVIGGNPVHLTEKEDLVKPVPVDKLYIDIGAKDEEDAKKHVALGDFAVFHAPFLELGENTLLGRAFDDRAGCALLLDIIQGEIPYDCTFAFTTTEEVGCVGGETAAFTVDPDYGIAVESTTASDIGGVEEHRKVCYQGKGPVLSFMDRGTVYNKDLYDDVFHLAQTKNIPCQGKQGVFGGNEARVIQTSRGGAQVLAVSLPTRYLHSPSNTVHVQDVKHTRQLLGEMIPYLATR